MADEDRVKFFTLLGTHPNTAALKSGKLRSALVDFDFADDVADAVAGLLQIQVLLESDEVAIEPQPSAWRVRGRERSRRFNRGLFAVHAKVAERAGGPLREQDVDQLARTRPRVEHARVHHPLFPARGVSFSARDEDVVKERALSDGACVREVEHAPLVEPVIAVRAQHLRIGVIDFREELARPR